MVKDGIRDLVKRELRRAYDHVASEPVPEDMLALLRELK